MICIHDDMTFTVTCRTSNGLDQGCLRTQESLLVRIQDRYQRDLWNIQTFTKQVDTHQHVEHIQTHIPDDLHPFQGIHIRVKIPHPNAQFLHIIGQIFCHPLGQSGDQHLVFSFYFLADLPDQIINLSFHRTHRHLRIQKTGRPDDLFRSQQLMLRLIVSRCCRHEQHLIDLTLKFFKIQWTVILGRRQTESIVHQRVFPALVSKIHSADLWNGLVGLINDDQRIIGKIIHQRVRRLSRLQACQMSGIILNSRTESRLL